VAHGDRRLLDLAPAADLRERITQIHGPEFTAKLMPFEGQLGGVEVRGMAGRPVDALPRRDAQHFIVNGRAVQDRVLSHAVSQAYHNTMPPGRHPALFLDVRIPAEEVDVNVHPQKTEVRFRHGSAVHDLVRDSLGAALGTRGVVPNLTDLRPAAMEPRATAVREATLNYLGSHPVRAETPTTLLREPAGQGHSPVAREQAAAQAPSHSPEQPERSLDVGQRERQAVPLAQFRDSYIVAEDLDGLVLVDQHAAHERVLFEKYLADAEQNRVEVQRLLLPVTVELAPHERVVLDEELGEFARLGFLVEPFGNDAVRLDGVPAIATDLDPEALFRELLGGAARSSAAVADVAQVRLKLVTTAACKAAIKINHSLTTAGMQALLDDLYATNNPTTCPHGRPILFRLTLEEIERAFRRR